MKKILSRVGVIFILLMLSSSITASTQENNNSPTQTNQYYQGYVKEVVSEQNTNEADYQSTLKVELTEGPQKGQIKTVNFEKLGKIKDDQKIKSGDRIVVIQTESADGYSYFVVDKYRLDSIYLIIFITILVTIAVSGLKGINSILGLAISILILLKFLIPGLQMGQNPILVGLLASLAIAFTSMYLAHGVNRRTTVSLLATFITIIIALLLALWSVNITHLFGLGSEEAYFLQANKFGEIDLKGLLLAGIIVGTLGILDDITISQVSIVEELHDVDPSIGFWGLTQRGLNIGREHIASLINTLALAYVGVSLPLLLTFSITQNRPLWVLANSEFIAEELVRTLVGSITLIIAVPISTFLAAYFIKHPPKILKYLPKSKHHGHSHH
jgi:uncharacterized membrane protein